MADVQLEKGFTRIANELLQALMMFKLSGSEWAIIIAIIRLTYGYRRKKAQLSMGMIAKMTGLNRMTVWRRVQKLLKHKVLGRQKTKGEKSIDILWINKDYATWTISLRANRTIDQSVYRAIDRMANYIKKEKKYKEISNFKKKFLIEKTIN